MLPVTVPAHLHNRIVEFYMLGTFISAIVYGIVIVLSGNCMLLLQKKRAIFSKRMPRFLVTYITVMLVLSTEAIIQSTWFVKSAIFGGMLPIFIEHSPPALPLVIWGADGFMVSITILDLRFRISMTS